MKNPTLRAFTSFILKELTVFCRGPSFILSIVFFLCATVLPAFIALFTDTDIISFRQFSIRIPFVLIIVAPALVMGSWSSERISGTELLVLSFPVSDLLIVTGKFLSRLALYVVMLVCTFPVLLFADSGAGQAFTVYVLLLLYGAATISLAQFISFFFFSQVPAFLVSSLFLIVISTLHMVPHTLVLSDSLHSFLVGLSFVWHFEAAQRGILDSRDIVFYCIPAVGFLYANTVLLSRRRIHP